MKWSLFFSRFRVSLSSDEIDQCDNVASPRDHLLRPLGFEVGVRKVRVRRIGSSGWTGEWNTWPSGLEREVP
jgi:hypothetical protein